MTKKASTNPTRTKKTALAVESAAPTKIVKDKADKPAKKGAKAKQVEPLSKKPKLIRDSFTLPESDYAIFKDLKTRCLALGVETKKSALLRVALIALAKSDDTQLISALKALTPIKTGRPAKK